MMMTTTNRPGMAAASERHTVFQPMRLTPLQLERGYWSAYERFYRWTSIWRGAATKTELVGRLRHMAYAGGWKKFEPLWDFVIRARRVTRLLPVLEAVLAGFGKHAPKPGARAKVQFGSEASSHTLGPALVTGKSARGAWTVAPAAARPHNESSC